MEYLLKRHDTFLHISGNPRTFFKPFQVGNIQGPNRLFSDGQLKSLSSFCCGPWLFLSRHNSGMFQIFEGSPVHPSTSSSCCGPELCTVTTHVTKTIAFCLSSKNPLLCYLKRTFRRKTKLTWLSPCAFTPQKA